MSTPDVSHLNRELNSERVTFASLRGDLQSSLRPFSPPAHAEDHVISYADEVGAERAALKLATDPGHFGLNARPNDPALVAVKGTVEALHASREAMDRIVVQREDILAEADPKRDRVYISFGREFTIDLTHEKVRYVDTGLTEPLVIEEVEPRAAPPRARQKPKDKKRDRDM